MMISRVRKCTTIPLISSYTRMQCTRLGGNLKKKFNFLDILADALMKRIQLFLEENHSEDLGVGQIPYWGVRSNEPSGKPLDEMKKGRVRLTFKSSRRYRARSGVHEARIRSVASEGTYLPPGRTLFPPSMLSKLLLRDGLILSIHQLALNQVLVRGDVSDGNAFYGWETKWAE